jgi:hypothetical protein
MIVDEKNYTIALLIDTENVSAKYLTCLMQELIALGRVTYKRMYGDFTDNPKSDWRKLVNQFSIMPVQQYSYTTGKNVTDSKMIIDAMDILYTGNVDAFCIMSSDSDFTGLAKRLKESNMFVIGAGENKTPLSFINACDRFFKLDSLIKKGLEQKEETGRKKTPQRKRSSEVKDAKEPKESKEKQKEEKEEKESKIAAKQRQTKGTPLPQYKEEKSDDEGEEVATVIPREVVEDLVVSLFDRSDRDEMPLAFVMQKIFQTYPDFNPKDYGVSKASKFFDGKKFTQKKGKGTEVLLSLKEDS